MNVQTAWKLFREKMDELHALSHARGVLSYDGETVAPPASAAGRGRTLAYLSGKTYELQTNRPLNEAAVFLLAHRDELSEIEAREVELFLREKEFTASIPQEEYVGYVTLQNRVSAVWHRAKAENDFAAFAPVIREVFDTNRRFCLRYRPDEAPYDVQMGRFEHGLTMEKTDAFFDTLKARIVPLLKKVLEKPQVDDSFLRGKFFPVEPQREFAEYLMGVLCLPRDRCSIGETEHPFTTHFNRDDVRITTHYRTENPVYSMYSVIHEGGHALYELHTAPELNGTILGKGVSMSIHEGQSRFMENYIGRSRPFIELIFPKLQALFPAQFAGVSAEQLWLAVNKAEPTLIRTQADELTYALHVLVRYEIEKGLFDGSVQAEDLQAVWNAKYREYLGIEVPDDRRGVLQDSHWSTGYVGYFPSYALGSAYGAQLLAKMKQTVDVDAVVASGDLRPILAWLEDRIWKYGALRDPMDVLESALEAPFDPRYFTDYLEEKYTRIYGL